MFHVDDQTVAANSNCNLEPNQKKTIQLPKENKFQKNNNAAAHFMLSQLYQQTC